MEPQLREAAAVASFYAFLSKKRGYDGHSMKTEYRLAPSARVDLAILDSDQNIAALVEFKTTSSVESSKDERIKQSLRRYIQALPLGSNPRLFAVRYSNAQDINNWEISEYQNERLISIADFPTWFELTTKPRTEHVSQFAWTGEYAEEKRTLAEAVQKARNGITQGGPAKGLIADNDAVSSFVSEVRSQLDLRFTDIGVPHPWRTDEELFLSVTIFEDFLQNELRKRSTAKISLHPRESVNAIESLQKSLHAIVSLESVNRLPSILEYKANGLSVGNAKSPIDILVVVAMDDPELDEVLNVIDFPEHVTSFSKANHAVCWLGTLAGGNATVLAATQNDMGMTNAAVLATKLILHYRPTYVVMTGIAAGMDAKSQQVGDILVPTHTNDLGLGKLEREADFAIFKPKMYQKDVRDHFDRHADVRAATRTPSFMSAIDESLKTAYPKEYKKIIKRPVKIFTGPFGSGGTVVADPQEVGVFKSVNGALIGFDMEAHAIVTAAAECGLQTTPQVMVAKAICDFAGEDKGKDKDAKQRLAARASAQFFRLFFLSYVYGSASVKIGVK